MSSEETAQSKEIKGGVIIQGSLFWEDESNCLPNDKKGKKRKEWRENHLSMEKSFPIPFPIRYGRCSSTRLCTYTMVISKDYLSKDRIGQAKIVPFRRSFDPLNLAEITLQMKHLTEVEGISSKGDKFAKDYGAIAIWIKPDSNFTPALETYWNGLMNQYDYNKPYTYDWSDSSLITQNYKLDMDIADVDLDFLLLTYMQPKHREIYLDAQQQYPTPQAVAEEIRRSGYSTYFCQNRFSGIITSDDDEIIKHKTQLS